MIKPILAQFFTVFFIALTFWIVSTMVLNIYKKITKINNDTGEKK